MARIYLDVCCLNRPYDDLRPQRVRQESDAVLAIIERIEGGDDIWMAGNVVIAEIERGPDRQA